MFLLLLSRRKTNLGFSLVELLVVIAIVGILAALALPSVSGMLNSEGMNLAVNNIPSTLDQARAYAMANKTYVWVGFSSNVESQELSVGVVAGITGDASDLKNSHFTSIAKPQTFSHLILKNITINDSTMSSSEDDISASQVGAFDQKTASKTISYTNVLQFSPMGEATMNIQPPDGSHWIQIGLQPTRGGTSAPNVAVLQVAALTGAVHIFRP